MTAIISVNDDKIREEIMRIGLAYDTKEDYSFEGDASYFDFTTLAELSYVKHSIERCGHTTSLLGNYSNILKQYFSTQLNSIDLVFNMSEGLKSRNREGSVPSLLEMANIPFVGSDAYALSLCLNKHHSKIMAEHLNILTPEYFIINALNDIKEKTPRSYPCVLKPIYEGTSSGIKLVKSYNEYILVAELLLNIFQQPILCEKYIEGREFTVSLIGTGADTTAVGMIETVRKNGLPIGIFSSDDKMYSACIRKLPHDIPDEIKNRALDWAIKFHTFTECRDLNRIDYRLDAYGNLYFLEANPLPGLSISSAFPNCCLLHKLSFEDALQKIITSAIKRYT